MSTLPGSRVSDTALTVILRVCEAKFRLFREI